MGPTYGPMMGAQVQVQVQVHCSVASVQFNSTLLEGAVGGCQALPTNKVQDKTQYAGRKKCIEHDYTLSLSPSQGTGSPIPNEIAPRHHLSFSQCLSLSFLCDLDPFLGHWTV